MLGGVVDKVDQRGDRRGKMETKSMPPHPKRPSALMGDKYAETHPLHQQCNFYATLESMLQYQNLQTQKSLFKGLQMPI